jgi:hypothetical protein
MNFSRKNIPQIKLTSESTKELRETLKWALTEILKESCPCRYPRFRYLINFKHDNYDAEPVFCADTNYLVSIACSGESGYLILTSRITENIIGNHGEDLVYTCQKCGTVYKNISKQYSINFEFEYLVILEPKYLPDIGADLTFPFPLLQGLFGFDDNAILKCSKEFTLGNADQVFNYLTKKVKT